MFSFFFVVNTPVEVKAQATGVLFSKTAQSKKIRKKAVKAYKMQQKKAKEAVPKAVLKKSKLDEKQYLENKQKHIDAQSAEVKARIIASEQKAKRNKKKRKR